MKRAIPEHDVSKVRPSCFYLSKNHMVLERRGDFDPNSKGSLGAFNTHKGHDLGSGGSGAAAPSSALSKNHEPLKPVFVVP
jgi:hypothetical protein